MLRSLVGSEMCIRDRERNREQRLPTWQSDAIYDIGDVVSYKFAAGSIVNIPGGLQIPPVDTTSELRYTVQSLEEQLHQKNH